MKYIEKDQKNRHISTILEKQIIGYISNNPNKVVDIASRVKDSWFLDNDLRVLYGILKSSTINGTDPYADILKHGISATLYAECLKYCPISDYALEQTIESFRVNSAKHAVETLVESSSEKEVEDPFKFIAQLQQNLIQISSNNELENTGTKELVTDFEHLQQEFDEKNKNGDSLLGISCGFPKIDECIDGLRKGHLWVCGGYTSSGKTFFALNVVANLIKQGKKVAFFSLEMSKVDIIGRLLGLLTDMSSYFILKHEHTTEEREKIEEAKKILVNSGLTIHSKNNHIDTMLMSMLSQSLRGNLDCIVIDYAQLIQSNFKNEYDTLTDISVKLQAFAQKYEVPIILLSQISNEAARNPDSDVIGFKGSGALAASADMAIELVNSEKDKAERMRKFREGKPVDVRLTIKKNRHGRTGEVDLSFFPRTGIFKEGVSFIHDTSL